MPGRERPRRIGSSGEARQQGFREDTAVTLAVREQARADGTSLSEIVRVALREYLEDHGWDVLRLLTGDVDAIDAEWVARLGRRPPRTREQGSSDAIDPTGTIHLF